MKIDDPTRAAAERKRLEAARRRKQAAARARMEHTQIDREIRSLIGERAERDRAARWIIAGACGLCGLQIDPPPLDYQGRPVGSARPVHELARGRFGLPHGIRAQLCQPCDKAIEKGDRKGLLRRLEAHRPGYDAESLHPSQLVGLTYAGAVLAARDRGEPDPIPAGTPFGHLPDRLEALDLPEPPPPPTPAPADPRLIEGACVVCGSTANLDDVHRRLDARWFGLDGQPIRGRVCAGCGGILFGPGGPVFYRNGPDYGLFAGVAVAVKTRIARTRPDAWPLTPSDEYLALASLPPFTFAGAVILAREQGDPEPAAGVPFGWLT